jgi:hypothetical protein
MWSVSADTIWLPGIDPTELSFFTDHHSCHFLNHNGKKENHCDRICHNRVLISDRLNDPTDKGEIA